MLLLIVLQFYPFSFVFKLLSVNILPTNRKIYIKTILEVTFMDVVALGTHVPLPCQIMLFSCHQEVGSCVFDGESSTMY